MHFIVYKVTNIITGKIYIGCHKTENIEDGYMGSGVYLKRAQEKYGIENFKKEILHIFDNSQMMFEKESELVDENFVLRSDTYNLKVGGSGGFDFINRNRLNTPTTEEATENHRINSSKNGVKCREEGKGIFSLTPEQRKENSRKGNESFYANGGVSCFSYLNHDPEFREKINKRLKEIDHQKGEKNSQFGTKWIHNEELKVSKRIKKEEDIPDGWKLGRKIKFE